MSALKSKKKPQKTASVKTKKPALKKPKIEKKAKKGVLSKTIPKKKKLAVSSKKPQQAIKKPVKKAIKKVIKTETKKPLRTLPVKPDYKKPKVSKKQKTAPKKPLTLAEAYKAFHEKTIQEHQNIRNLEHIGHNIGHISSKKSGMQMNRIPRTLHHSRGR